MDNTETRKKLVLAVLENGIGSVADWLVETNGCNFAAYRADGTVLYKKNIFDEATQQSPTKLSYSVSTHEGMITLTLTGLNSDKLEQGMNSLQTAEFAVQCYCSKGGRQSQPSLKNGGVVKYTIDQRLTRAGFLDIVKTHCDPSCQYYVSVLNDCTKEEQRYMAKNLKRTDTFNISVVDNKNLVLIVRHMYNPLTNTIDVNSPSEEEQQDIFRRVLELYGGKPKFATGSSCYPSDLYLSYQQARFTMSFMKLTGHKTFTKRYSDLDMGIPLMSNNWLEIEEYCLRHLSSILEFDEKNNTSYFETLHTYLETNCNGKEAADRLYIHVNTLYYRLKKIEALIGYSISDMSSITHLYHVTTLYKALKDSEIMDEFR